MLAILLFLFLFRLFSSPILATSQAVIINQARGNENCCQPGSVDLLEQQIKAQIDNQLPAYFALRYDALTDPIFLNQIKKAHATYPELIKPAVLIEIIPSLAHAADVSYQAKPQNSHQAQHIFTLGYSPEDRKKLLDQLFKKFHQQLGIYPDLTVAWMIDTNSLNYLQDQYQIKAHLITREQWGTDTYHLYGGPPHYPYPASRSWAFVPNYQASDPLLILRQTITDPANNYGNTTSSFTSQPNDYLNAGKNLSYFKHLLNQALFNQPHTGFALLGLENSMEEKYQQEFLLQLEYLKKLYQTNQVTFPTLSNLLSTWQKTPITTYQADQASWVTTPNYRVRLLTKDNQTLITDLRLYHPQLQDPYTNYQAIKEGYWITPYLLDGSLNQKQEKTKRSVWLKLFGPPAASSSLTKAQPDLNNQTTALVIPANPTFNQDSIVFNNANINQFKYQDLNSTNHPIKFSKSKQSLSLTWNSNNQVSHQLQVTCKQNQCVIKFQLDPDTFNLARQFQYPFLFPERKPRPTDPKNTVLYVHNRYAIANRNPVRVIFIPKDKFGLPITPEEETSFETSPLVSFSNQQDQSSQIIDLTSPTPISTKLTVKLGNQTLKTTTVFLAPNCKTNPSYCLTHPRQTLWYLKAILHDKIRKNLFGETQ